MYQETREVSGVTLHTRSRIRSWEGWPDDVRETLRSWNRLRLLSFVGMDTIARVPPQPSFKCVDCGRFINPSGSTACKLEDYLICDDCIIDRARSPQYVQPMRRQA